MPQYLVTEVANYLVEAGSLREALNNYHIHFDEIEPEVFEMDKATISQNDYQYQDGNVTAKEL